MDKSKNHNNMLSLGRCIKILRKQRSLTQEGLAVQSGVSYTTLTKIENEAIKNPSFESIAAIARGLSISLDELIQKVFS
jgi:transcriptional regulator with XRE-family HTH domain